MHRRNFIKKATMAGAVFTFPPFMSSSQDQDYSVAELMGKEDVKLHGEGINLRKKAYKAFIEMKKAACTDGFDIKIISSYRDFYRQESIWERKYIRFTEDYGMEPLDAIDKIIEYSTIPGTSRHHWGTDIDIVDGHAKTSGDVLLPEKFGPGGPFETFKLWLDQNSENFGYYLVYTDNPKRKGFKYEPWHFSYAPLAVPMLTAFRKKNILKLLQNEKFIGCGYFTKGFLKTYVQDNILDINQELL